MSKPASPWSLGRSLLEPAWRKDEAHLFQMLPYGYIVSETAISTRNGGLLGAAEIRGVNADTLETPAFEALTERFRNILRGVGAWIAHMTEFALPNQLKRAVLRPVWRG